MKAAYRKSNAGEAREEPLSDTRPPLPKGAGPKVSGVIVPLITFLLILACRRPADVMSPHRLGNRLAALLAAKCGLPSGSRMGKITEKSLKCDFGPARDVYYSLWIGDNPIGGHNTPLCGQELLRYRSTHMLKYLNNTLDLTGRVSPARSVRASKLNPKKELDKKYKKNNTCIGLLDTNSKNRSKLKNKNMSNLRMLTNLRKKNRKYESKTITKTIIIQENSGGTSMSYEDVWSQYGETSYGGVWKNQDVNQTKVYGEIKT